MEPFKICELLEVAGGKLVVGSSHLTVSGVSTDSRNVCPGDLFVALRGTRFDGNEFAAAALEHGAAAALVEKGRRPKALNPGQAIVEVPDTGRALLDLARWYRGKFSVRSVAITGSCGKTTTKEILAHLLSRRFRVVRSQKSFNNAVGVPLTVFSLDRKTEIAVFELGTNAPGEIGALASIVKPQGGIITNIFESHLQGLSSVDGVLEEKGSLLESLPEGGFAIINADDPRAEKLRERTKAKTLFISCNTREADLWASDIVFHGFGTSFKLNGEFPVTLPMLGTHNVSNALQALGACTFLGLELAEALEGLEGVPTAAHRLERKRFGSLEVLDDSYNSNPGSARAAIRALQGLGGGRRKAIILGDMLELGERSAGLHFEIGYTAGASGVDLFVAVGSEAAQMAKGAIAGGMSPSQVFLFPDTRSAVLGVPRVLEPGDLVLVKGSRKLALETMVEALSKKWGYSSSSEILQKSLKRRSVPIQG